MQKRLPLGNLACDLALELQEWLYQRNALLLYGKGTLVVLVFQVSKRQI